MAEEYSVPVGYHNGGQGIWGTGDNVRTIQDQLNTISNNYPAIPKLVADGIFGSRTAESVKIFQKIFSLSQDGIVGFAAWYKISAIYVAVTKMAELS